MGTSTNAYLFFGIDHVYDDDGDNPIPWKVENDEEASDFIAQKYGLNSPTCEYNGNEKLYSDYWNKKSDLMESIPCEIDCHCSDGYPIYFIALKDKYKIALRGYGTTIEPNFLDVTDKQKQQLKEFGEKIGVDCSNPKWRLVSYWG
jgi:hypothetical protein